jgi:hypothetical protein
MEFGLFSTTVIDEFLVLLVVPFMSFRVSAWHSCIDRREEFKPLEEQPFVSYCLGQGRWFGRLVFHQG